MEKTIKKEKQEKTTEKKSFNGAALGSIGFAIATLLLNLQNVHAYDLSSMILAVGLAVGAFVQIVAGIFEAVKGHNFTGIAFIAYGFYWLSQFIILLVEAGGNTLESAANGCFLLMWAILTLFMFIASFKHSIMTRISFGTLMLTFLILSIHAFTNVDAIQIVGGSIGIVCGLSAFYSAIGQIINGEFNKKIFPLL